MQTVGPGSYASPPAISGSAIGFLGMGDPGLAVPAGATQLFRFGATRSGRAIITFQPTDGFPGQTRPDVLDTVDVW